MILVKMKHVRACDLCSRGTRQWFKQHNLNYTQFLQEGTPVETIESIGDAFGLKVSKIAREEAEASNGQR